VTRTCSLAGDHSKSPLVATHPIQVVLDDSDEQSAEVEADLTEGVIEEVICVCLAVLMSQILH
jgi:hypothetical protein